MRKKAALPRKPFSQRIRGVTVAESAASILRARADHASRRAEMKNRTFMQ
jgi:3-oxoacyl-(acyl-carrier-protein) synthase